MDNKGFDDIEMQPPWNSTDLPANGDYENVEKSSMKGMDENEISKKPLEEYIEPHDGPYAGKQIVYAPKIVISCEENCTLQNRGVKVDTAGVVTQIKKLTPRC